MHASDATAAGAVLGAVIVALSSNPLGNQRFAYDCGLLLIILVVVVSFGRGVLTRFRPHAVKAVTDDAHKNVSRERISNENDKQSDLQVREGTPVLSKKCQENHAYKEELHRVEKQLLEESDLMKEPVSSEGNSEAIWDMVLKKEGSDGFYLEVHRRAGEPFHFRLVADFEASPATTFDFLASVENRSKWDELWQEAGTLEDLSPGVAVQFMRTKALWPTSARDAVVVSLTKTLAEDTFMTVATSIPSHSHFTSRSGDVRMDVLIAGQLVMPDPQGRPNRSRMVSIVHSSLNGWIPSSVVAQVTTQAFPVAMKRANRILKTMASYSESTVMREIQQAATADRGSPAAMTITKVERKSKPPSPAVSSAQLSPPSNRLVQSLKFVSRLLVRAQPWMVAVMFLALLINKFKRTA